MTSVKRLDVAAFIKTLREIDPKWMKETFTNGACFELYRLIAQLWPEAEPWIARWMDSRTPTGYQCHVFARIGREFFDIDGARSLTAITRQVKLRDKRGRFAPMEEWEIPLALEMNVRRLAAREEA